MERRRRHGPRVEPEPVLARAGADAARGAGVKPVLRRPPAPPTLRAPVASFFSVLLLFFFSHLSFKSFLGDDQRTKFLAEKKMCPLDLTVTICHRGECFSLFHSTLLEGAFSIQLCSGQVR